MYAWCAYCQRLIGERAPFDVFLPTHGMCEACEERGLELSDDAIARIRPIAAFHRELLAHAVDGDEPSVADTLARGRELGLRPIELLFGILQPSLYRIGELWSRGELDPAREARFTAFCDRVFAELEAGQPAVAPGAPRLLLMSAQWNRHTLGPRMIAFLLRERGRDARYIQTPALDQLATVIAEARVDIVGVSIATERQVGFLDEVLAATAALSPQPRVWAGGMAVRAGCSLPPGIEAQSGDMLTIA